MIFFPLPFSLLRLLIKVLVIAVVLAIVVGIIALKVIERSPDQLKVGFESYLTQISGYPAEIGSLDKVQFFPHLIVDMKDTRFWPLDDPDGKAISIERLNADMPLWSVMTGQPRFNELSLHNMVIAKDVTGIDTITIKSVEPNEEKNALTIEGLVGRMKINAALPMEQTASGQYRMLRPPLRIDGTVEGGRTKGSYFIDLNPDGYGATANFETYRAEDMRSLQLLLQGLLVGKSGKILPIQMHIEALVDENGGKGGPYTVPAIQLENGDLQPLQCFYNNQGRARVEKHPCAVYFKEPDLNTTP